MKIHDWNESSSSLQKHFATRAVAAVTYSIFAAIDTVCHLLAAGGVGAVLLAEKVLIVKNINGERFSAEIAGRHLRHAKTLAIAIPCGSLVGLFRPDIAAKHINTKEMPYDIMDPDAVSRRAEAAEQKKEAATTKIQRACLHYCLIKKARAEFPALKARLTAEKTAKEIASLKKDVESLKNAGIKAAIDEALKPLYGLLEQKADSADVETKATLEALSTLEESIAIALSKKALSASVEERHVAIKTSIVDIKKCLEELMKLLLKNSEDATVAMSSLRRSINTTAAAAMPSLALTIAYLGGLILR